MEAMHFSRLLKELSNDKLYLKASNIGFDVQSIQDQTGIAVINQKMSQKINRLPYTAIRGGLDVYLHLERPHDLTNVGIAR